MVAWIAKVPRWQPAFITIRHRNQGSERIGNEIRQCGVFGIVESDGRRPCEKTGMGYINATDTRQNIRFLPDDNFQQRQVPTHEFTDHSGFRPVIHF